MHERVEGFGIVKHSFILLFAKVNVKNIKFKETRAGELKWFNVEELGQDKIIPSDQWLIRHSLNRKMTIPRLYMHESEGIIESHRFLD
jgi:hypothetical protein